MSPIGRDGAFPLEDGPFVLLSNPEEPLAEDALLVQAARELASLLGPNAGAVTSLFRTLHTFAVQKQRGERPAAGEAGGGEGGKGKNERSAYHLPSVSVLAHAMAINLLRPPDTEKEIRSYAEHGTL